MLVGDARLELAVEVILYWRFKLLNLPVHPHSNPIVLLTINLFTSPECNRVCLPKSVL